MSISHLAMIKGSMLRRILTVFVMLIVAANVVVVTGGARAAGKAQALSVAMSDVEAGAPAAMADRGDLPDISPILDRNGHCLHTPTIPSSVVAADRDDRSDRLRWIHSTAFLTQVHPSPSHPPPVSPA